MIAAVLFVVGGVASAGLWSVLSSELRSSPALDRVNYRGHHLPVAAGVVLVLAATVVGAAVAVIVRAGGLSPSEAVDTRTLLGGGLFGFALIGMFDDLVGAVHAKGFRGHLGAAARGQVTTGLVKLVWGVMFGVLAVPGPLIDSLRAGVLIAATANLANLFDRAPGRVIKVSLLGGAVVAAAGLPAWDAAGPFLVLGAGAGLLIPDLRERCMLGDTGANVLGAAVGFGLVLALGATGQWVALGVVVVANLASEVVSFSRVIDHVAPLRWFDRLGATPERKGWSPVAR